MSALVLASSSLAFAQSAVHDWQQRLAVTAVDTTPASLGTVNGKDGLFFTNGNKVYALDADDGTGLNSGDLSPGPGDVFTASGTIENFVSVVTLLGTPYIFLTDSQGILYKVRASDMLEVGYADLKRGSSDSCTTQDTLHATPTVQLSAYSSSSWTYKGIRDVVYVITYDGCGDTTDNQVIAFDANNFPDGGYSRDLPGSGELWTFGGDGHLMSYGSQGCFLDYDRNALYCGTDLPEGRVQPTLWAISTGQVNGEAAGQLSWFAVAGSLHNRPQLDWTNGHVYAADESGMLHAYDADTGALAWEMPVSDTAAPVSQNLWAEFRDGYGGTIFVTDDSGLMDVSEDFDTSGAVFWNQSFGAAATSIPTFAPSLGGKVYVGLSDGTMHQLDLATRADEATYTIGGSTDVVLDGVLQVADGATDVNKIITIADGPDGVTVKRFGVPFSPAGGAIPIVDRRRTDR